MTADRDTRPVPEGEAVKAVAKAREFLAAAEASLAASRWNAAGLDAIHAGIAAGDAALIASAGKRSVSKDHYDVVGMLAEAEPAFLGPQQRQLTGLLKTKNSVAYEQRLLTEMDARRLFDHARRFLRWSASVVGTDAD